MFRLVRSKCLCISWPFKNLAGFLFFKDPPRKRTVRSLRPERILTGYPPNQSHLLSVRADQLVLLRPSVNTLCRSVLISQTFFAKFTILSTSNTLHRDDDHIAYEKGLFEVSVGFDSPLFRRPRHSSSSSSLIERVSRCGGSF